jgi:alkylation response protein AidB-like acyl-CoA dehydrogenase
MSSPEPALATRADAGPAAGPSLRVADPDPAPAPDAPADLDGWFEARAADVDEGRADVREGIALLLRHDLAGPDVEAVADLIAGVARSDLASAFSAWAHRMVLAYVAEAPGGAGVRDELQALGSGERTGSTALAAGTAHHLAGAPLTVRYRERDGVLSLDGTIAWASNLLAPFLCVTAAAHEDDPTRTVVVALRDDDAGLSLAPYPRLLALQATGSSSVRLEGVRVPADRVVSRDLSGFLARVLPTFLVLQSAFCRGLAGRALDEAEARLGPMGEVVRDDLLRVRAASASAERRARELARRATADPAAVPLRDLLELRLEWARLASEAVRLELVLSGGRGYLGASPTARRLREAAFLPVQAPTEVLLRWILSRSA